MFNDITDERAFCQLNVSLEIYTFVSLNIQRTIVEENAFTRI